MLHQFKLISNVGAFDRYVSSDDHSLAELTLIYGENGTGKTTLSSILRSANRRNPVPVQKRRRLGAESSPKIVLNLKDGNEAVFEDGNWSSAIPHVWIFDDAFVEDNVHSGLQVEPHHRQGLHEVVIGRKGVELARRVDELTREISERDDRIKEAQEAFSKDVLNDMTVEEFCALEKPEDLEKEIEQVESELKALNNADAIKKKETFNTFVPPEPPVNEVREVLTATIEDVEESAVDQVQRHFEKFEGDAERWVDEGVSLLESMEDSDQECPFCRQDLSESPIFPYFLTYFGEAYRQHVERITSTRQELEEQFSGDALADYRGLVGQEQDKRSFWSDYVEIPESEVDLDGLAPLWRECRDELLTLLDEKSNNPLQSVRLSEEAKCVIDSYEEKAAEFEGVSKQLNDLNDEIEDLKTRTTTGDIDDVEARLKHLETVRLRYTEEYCAACDEYEAAVNDKKKAEEQKEKVRERLDHHREATFPQYQENINSLLAKFGAGFRLDNLTPTNPGGYPSSEYHIAINNETVSTVADPDDRPSFRTTLSAGDRRTLALAFFLTALRQEDDVSEHIIVVDDPLSSMDQHRRLVTVQELRKIQRDAGQLIVLAHRKGLLCGLHDHIGGVDVSSLQVKRIGNKSEIVSWDIQEASITEYDRRHSQMRDYLSEGGNIEDAREVAQALRPILEGYLRVVCTEHFPPGMNLGGFISEARQALERGDPFLSPEDYEELCELNEYARRFHHDTNSAYEEDLESLNEGELQAFCERVRDYTTPAVELSR